MRIIETTDCGQETGGYLIQIEGDTSMITFLLFFISNIFFFCCPLSFTGTMGKGAIIQTGKSPIGLPVQISGNQKNKLNDPGGGSFRYNAPGEHMPF